MSVHTTTRRPGPVHGELPFDPATAAQLKALPHRTMLVADDEDGQRAGVWIVAYARGSGWLVTSSGEGRHPKLQLPFHAFTDEHTAGLRFRVISWGKDTPGLPRR